MIAQRLSDKHGAGCIRVVAACTRDGDEIGKVTDEMRGTQW